jgi:hypothetical protein
MGDIVRGLVADAQLALAVVQVALSLTARVGVSVYSAVTGLLVELGVEVVLPLVTLAGLLR